MGANNSFAAKIDYVQLGKDITSQEQELVFQQFSNDDALSLGLFMIEKAKKEGKAITIDINRNGQQLFHYALTGTAPENDIWIERKNEVTRRSNRSSLAMWYWQEEGWMKDDFHMSYMEMWGLDPQQAMNLGGAFPLTIKDVGVVGTITVSGLAHYQDHAFVVDALSDYLNSKS
ncbi:hypothetical protein JCM19239_6105 [Vibrio variabilis]|uniref:Uncharacterized protein n=1 Tax=Vibrio variabilis TaxID=990271 RepID=A0ABQ0JJV2_9VIBR|nr:hypothetical protein JCM19239_6105 [Vibrio variabilis]